MKDLTPEEWRAALRSGNYTQGRGHLRFQLADGSPYYDYCCLGVACDLVDPDRWNEDLWDQHLGTPPASITKQIVPNLRVLLTEMLFAGLNDTLRWSFDEIAVLSEWLDSAKPVDVDENDLSRFMKLLNALTT